MFNRNVTIQLPEIKHRNEFAATMLHMLNGLARVNAEWVLDEWAHGRVPKCCAKCNKTRYVEDGGAPDITLRSSPVIFQRGQASCGEIAACHTGHKIAEAFKGEFPGIAGPISWDEACRRFTVIFDERAPDKGPGYFHALCNDDGKIIDPTQGMTR